MSTTDLIIFHIFMHLSKSIENTKEKENGEKKEKELKCSQH